MKIKSQTEHLNKPDNKMRGAPPWTEALLRELADNISDGVYCINTDGYFTFVNRAITERSGISSDKFDASHFLDIVHPAYRDLTAQNFQKVMRGENVLPYELRYESADGQERIVEVNSKPLHRAGQVVGLLGISRDITERKQIEEALRASEKKFRSLIEKMPIGIFTYDGTKATYINPFCEVITGYALDDMYRMEVWDVVKPEFREGMKSHMQLRQRGEPVPERHEFKIVTKTGEERWLERVSIELQGEKEPLVLFCVFDITDRKQAEDTLEKLVEERTVELFAKNKQLIDEIKERRRAGATLRRKGHELQLYSKKLQELNTALKVLLKGREEDKTELEEKIISNVKELVEPYVEKLKKTRLNTDQSSYVNIIETHLNNIVSPFLRTLASKHPSLTARQIQIAELIMADKTTKEIADLLNLSTKTIEFHRDNIRKKFGLKNQKENLRTYLLSFKER